MLGADMSVLRNGILLVAAFQLSACGLYVPAKTFQSETPDPNYPYTSPEGDYENKIVGHLVCEVANGIFAATTGFNLPWLKSQKWGTAITLTITAQDQSGISPGLSFIKPFANKVFTFPTGGPVLAHNHSIWVLVALLLQMLPEPKQFNLRF
jgi:hypothetical protein